MISLFSHAISALLSKLFDKWTNKYIDRENEENSYRKCVRVSKAFSIAGGSGLSVLRRLAFSALLSGLTA